MNILVTGGAGFIGSNFICSSVPSRAQHSYTNLDSLTYAANLHNLSEVEHLPNYSFIQADIRDFNALHALFEKHQPDIVVHFAAESHVDRSISGPSAFVETNINGTFNLLEVCRNFWAAGDKAKLFLHVSTDEVYGSLGPEGYFTETTPYSPRSPYSASKAASDHLAKAYYHTYGLPVIVTHCSNNYGPRQFPEKLIPLIINNALAGKPLPLYGDGLNVRDWIYVEDHVKALWTIIEKGKIGETYNVGGESESTNLALVERICAVIAAETGVAENAFTGLITFVKDRPGHDRRYAIDNRKIRAELGWKPLESLDTGLRKTVKWYLENRAWVEQVSSGDYRKWLVDNYENR